MTHQVTALDFSNYLFWDVEKGKIDFDKSKAYVIERVLSHGMLSDWYVLKAYYGKETIREIVLHIRHLDKYALHFCAAYFDEPLERFRCFNYAQSNPVHWDY